MPYKYSSDIIAHAPNDLININSCGELKLSADSHIIRPRGRKDYQLIYIFGGHCYVAASGEILTASPGDVVIYRPYEPQDYLFLGKDNPHTVWIHFSGTVCESIFDDLALNSTRLIKSSHNRDIAYLVTGICKHFQLKTANYPLICSGMLTSVLALISGRDDAECSERHDNSRNVRLISELISRFKMAPNLRMDISDCAKLCKISQSHFTRIFKEITGTSPQQFIIHIRIDRARELLAFTDKSMSDIAEATGFKSQNYFSRIFKQYVGMTPSQYRKTK